jgi:hypothetical protein
VIFNGRGATTNFIAADLFWLGFPLSDTVATKFEVPLAVSVPEISPVVGFRLKPAGRLPDVIDHAYAGVPPLADRSSEKEWPTMAENCVADRISNWLGSTETVRGWVALLLGLLLSLTDAVNVFVPLVVGLPEMVPFGASVSPAGRLPDMIDHL